MLSEYIHSTYDVYRLRFVVVANILHVDNCAHQVNSQPQMSKVLLSEQPHMRTQHILATTIAKASLANSKIPHHEVMSLCISVLMKSHDSLWSQVAMTGVCLQRLPSQRSEDTRPPPGCTADPQSLPPDSRPSYEETKMEYWTCICFTGNWRERVAERARKSWRKSLCNTYSPPRIFIEPTVDSVFFWSSLPPLSSTGFSFKLYTSLLISKHLPS